jgi:hypothetical protein
MLNPLKGLTRVYRAPDELMARAILALLTDSGIDAVLRPFTVSVYGGIGAVLYSDWGEILVREADAGQAGELIAGFLAAEPLDFEEPSA